MVLRRLNGIQSLLIRLNLSLHLVSCVCEGELMENSSKFIVRGQRHMRR